MSSLALTPVEQVARYVFLMRSFVEKLGGKVNDNIHSLKDNNMDINKVNKDTDSNSLQNKQNLRKKINLNFSLENIDLSSNLDDTIDCFAETLSILGIFAEMQKDRPLFVIQPPRSPLPDLLDKGGVTSIRGAKRKLVDELLENYLKAHPKNQDQLLDILDGYLIGDERAAWTGTVSSTACTFTSSEGGIHYDKCDGNGDFNVNDESLMMQTFSSDVWHVLQSLPPHPRIYTKLMELGGAVMQSNSAIDRDGTLSPTPASFRALFDTTQPFRLLYTLQIVDSLLTCESMHTQNLSSSRKVSRPIVSNISRIHKVALSWTLEFIGIGGPEYIVDLLYTMCEKTDKNTSKTCEDCKADPKERRFVSKLQLPFNVDKEGFLTVMMRSDVSMLTISILLRILHKLLLVDPLYVVIFYENNCDSLTSPTGAATESKASSGGSRLFRRSKERDKIEAPAPSIAGCLGASSVPSGLVTSFIDIPKLIQVVLRASCRILEDVVSPSNEICSDAACLQLLCQHVILLVFGLSNVSLRSGGPSIEYICVGEDCTPDDNFFGSTLQMTQRFLTMACVEISSNPLRVASCRQLLHSLVSVIEQTDQIETSNAILDFWLDFFVSLLPKDEIDPRHEQLSALVGSIIYLRSSADTQILLPRFASRLMLVHPIPSVSSDFAAYIETDGSLYMSSDLSVQSLSFAEGDDSAAGCLCVVASLIATNDVSLDNDILFPLIEFIFQKCLLPSSTSDKTDFAVPLCRSAVARRLAYRTLIALCQDRSTNMSYLLQRMQESNELEKSENFTTWNYDPTAFMKRQKFVGLTNQGATCYINSFLQQLFLTKEFTDEFLSIENEVKTEEVQCDDQNKPPRNGSDEIIYQLKILLGSLSMSSKAIYDTIPFCKSLRDFDGNPINLAEQKDMVEFANSLFDTLENDKNCKKLLSSTFQGKLVYTIESTECDYRSEREEPFYIITAEVKNKPSLEASFQLFVEPELLSGDNKIQVDATATEAAHKVEANRRCSFRDLPNTLIIHLKRFDFDLETLDMKKLNDAFAFPRDLDMLPYCEEGLNESKGIVTAGEKRDTSYYKYSLKGIVAHIGAINSGHYYSFIQHDDDASYGANDSSTWSEFNDSRVNPFNPNLIPAECFGGAQDKLGRPIAPTNNVYGTTGIESQSVPYRQHNAYMLVYQRKNKMVYDKQNQSSGEITMTKYEKPRMSKKLYQDLLHANMSMLRDRLIISKMHFQFIWMLVNSCSPSRAHKGEIMTVECRCSLVLSVLKFTLEIATRCGAEECVLSLLNVTEKIIQHDDSGDIAQRVLEEVKVKEMEKVIDSEGGIEIKNSDGENHDDVSLLDQCHPWIREMLILCPNNVYMHSFYRLIFICVNKVAKTGYSLRSDMQAEVIAVAVAEGVSEQTEQEKSGVLATDFASAPKFLTDVFDSAAFVAHSLVPCIKNEYRTKCVDVTRDSSVDSLYNLFNQLLVIMETVSTANKSLLCPWFVVTFVQ